MSTDFTADAPEFAAAPQLPKRTTAQKIFKGPFGLRAGWSLAIYIGIIALIISAVHTVQHRQHAAKKSAEAVASSTSAPSVAKPAPKKPDTTLITTLVVESISFAVFLLLSRLMAKIERRRVGVFGLGGANAVGRFAVGAAWGLLAMSVLVGTLRGMHLLVFDGLLQHGLHALGYGAGWLLAFALVGLFEEYVFRGYLQFTLTRGLVRLGNLISKEHGRAIAFWLAAILTSGLFYFAHVQNGGENRLGLLSVFCAGMLFIVALWRTGSLWWAIGFHATWDWAQSFLYGVPDSGGLSEGRLFATHTAGNPTLSGGTVGPEGSIFVIPVLVLMTVVLFYTHPSPQPPLETLPPKEVEPASFAASTPEPDAL